MYSTISTLDCSPSLIGTFDADPPYRQPDTTGISG